MRFCYLFVPSKVTELKDLSYTIRITPFYYFKKDTTFKVF